MSGLPLTDRVTKSKPLSLSETVFSPEKNPAPAYGTNAIRLWRETCHEPGDPTLVLSLWRVTHLLEEEPPFGGGRVELLGLLPRPCLRAGAHLAENDPEREDIHRLVVALSLGNTGERAVRFGPLPALHRVSGQARPQPRTRTRTGSVGTPRRLPGTGTTWKSPFLGPG